MKSNMFKRSVMLHGHKTSVSLEAEFWNCLKQIAARERVSISALITRIDANREGNLSSAVRLFVLQDLQARVNPALRFGPSAGSQPGSSNAA
jgi:predicted DNA-binding ribbon-helix-helix protein